MKKTSLLFALVAAIALMLPSCSGNETADATGLLETIPSDASLVIVANTSKMLEKAGCKVKDDKIEASAETMALIDKIKNPQNRQQIKALFDGQTGIDPSVIACFQEGYYVYATGYLADPAKFKATVEKEMNAKFSTEEGIEICANTAVSDNRFWINLEQGSIDANEIKHFTALDDSQSFLSNAFADRLCKFDKDIEGWGNINGLLNTANLGFQQKAMMQVALQTLFADPAGLSFSVEFMNGEMNVEANVINSKGTYAKYQLPSEELDINTISSIGGKADVVAAIAVPHKMIEKLIKETSSQSPSVFGMYLNATKCIDGTCAVAVGSSDGVRGVLTTNGENSTAISEFLGSSGITITKDGKLLRLSKGEITGNAEVAELSKNMKGSIAGVAVYKMDSMKMMKNAVNSVIFTLNKQGDGILLKFNVKSNNDKENFLLSIIKQ